MTADIELLPLPAHFAHQHDNVKKIVREYAIANMAELADDRDDLLARLDASIDHGTKLGAAMQRCLDEVLEQKAEIEALRAEVVHLTRTMEATTHLLESAAAEMDRREAHAERLAEALRDVVADMREWGEPAKGAHVERIQRHLENALRDHAQESE